MKKRDELRQRRQKKARRQQLILMGAVALVAIAVAAWLIYPTLQPVGDFTVVEKEAWPFADGKALGPPGSPVLIQEFADFQCPFCGEFARGTERQLGSQFVTTGKVRFEFHHYIVVDGNVGGNESRRAAEASECANEQGEFWNYHKMLFNNQQGEGQGAFSDKRLTAFAEALSLDAAKFSDCFTSRRYANIVDADIALGQSLGVSGTPTVFINGQKVPLQQTLDMNYYEQVIQPQIQ